MTLDKPINFIDVEGTGLDVATDRIISLAVSTSWPNGMYRHNAWLFDPGVPIPLESTAVHGLTDADVQGKPAFKDYAQGIHELIDGVDIGGFNVKRYDAPIIWEELRRAGITWDWSKSRFVDVGNLFKKLMPRDLSAAVKEFCGREHVGAHGATADVSETMEVLKVMVARYKLTPTVTALEEASRMDFNLDLAGKLVLDKDGEACYNFGKIKFNHKNRTGAKVKDDVGLAQWAMDKDFPSETKMWLRRLIDEANRSEMELWTGREG